MKAWLLDQLTGVESLRLAEIAAPVAGPGEAVIDVLFAGLNPADRYLAKAEYPAKPTFPHILGRDGLGIIRSLGTGVSEFNVGDRVILLRSDVGVNTPGTLAEQVAVPVDSLAPVPPAWTDAEAAGAPLVYLTAYQALTQWGELAPSVVLVSGASGGVGVAAVQLAAAAGHTVVALSRSESKRGKLKTIGATHTFDPADPAWPDQIKKTLGRQRVDLAIDNIGGPDFSKLISVLAHRGKLSVVGRLAGPVPDFNPSTLLFRRIKIGGVAVGDFTAAESQSAWRGIVTTLDKAGVKPWVDKIFEFSQIQEAFRKLEQGPMGKVLVRIAPAGQTF